MKSAKNIEKEVKKQKVELISYSIKMTIPTAQFANIQPEIVVKAGSVEEAHDYIAPHLNKLWKEYYLVSERRPEPISGTKETPAHSDQLAPASSVAFVKASQAITSCLSEDALNLIETQIKKSVKLTEGDKEQLSLQVIGKRDQLLNGKVNPA